MSTNKSLDNKIDKEAMEYAERKNVHIQVADNGVVVSCQPSNHLYVYNNMDEALKAVPKITKEYK